MARPSTLKSSPLSKPPSTLSDTNETCPVCKSTRYLNSRLRLLVNPECYHKMCESCVDRIFSHGPAQCPIPGCQKTLRKNRFRQQTFEDLQIEREVDIRRRVAAVFNRREDEFETLRAWNDYLNEVEDITFNLVNGVDLAETEKRFEGYKKENERMIVENASLAEQERLSFAAQKKEERELAKQRREAARREEAEEKREAEETRRDVLNRLASDQDAERVTQEGQKVQLKKRMDRAAAAERQRLLQAADPRAHTSSSFLKGLKTKKNAAPEAPVDPFGGVDFSHTLYYTPQGEYAWAGVQETKADALIGAGGYDVASSFTARALCEAFAGLGVFIGDEGMREGSGEIGTVKAEIAAAREVTMGDAF